MEYRLVIQEPKDYSLRGLIEKVEEDRMEYFSELDIKDHVDLRLLKTLREFGVVLGGEDDTMGNSMINQENLKRPSFTVERKLQVTNKIYLDSMENLSGERADDQQSLDTMEFNKSGKKTKQKTKRAKRKTVGQAADSKFKRKGVQRRNRSRNQQNLNEVERDDNDNDQDVVHHNKPGKLTKSKKKSERDRIFRNDSDLSDDSEQNPENRDVDRDTHKTTGHDRIESIVLNVKSYHPNPERRKSQNLAAQNLPGRQPQYSAHRDQIRANPHAKTRKSNRLSYKTSKHQKKKSTNRTKKNKNKKKKKKKSGNVFQLNLDQSEEPVRDQALRTPVGPGDVSIHVDMNANQDPHQRPNKLNSLTMSLTHLQGARQGSQDLKYWQSHKRKNSKKPDIKKKFQEDLDDSAYMSRSHSNLGQLEEAMLNLYGSENLNGGGDFMLTRSQLVTQVSRKQPGRKRRTKTPEQHQASNPRRKRASKSKQNQKAQGKNKSRKKNKNKNNTRNQRSTHPKQEKINQNQAKRRGKRDSQELPRRQIPKITVSNPYQTLPQQMHKNQLSRNAIRKDRNRSPTPRSKNPKGKRKHHTPPIHLEHMRKLQDLTGLQPQMVYIKKSELVRRSNRSKASSKGSSEGSHHLYKPPKIKKILPRLTSNSGRQTVPAMAKYGSTPGLDRQKQNPSRGKREAFDNGQQYGMGINQEEYSDKRVSIGRKLRNTGGSLQVNRMGKLKRKTQSKSKAKKTRRKTPKYKRKQAKLKGSKPQKKTANYDTNKLLYSSLQVNRDARVGSIDIYSKIKRGAVGSNKKVQIRRDQEEIDAGIEIENEIRSRTRKSSHRSDEEEIMFNLSKTDNSPNDKEGHETGKCLMFNFSGKRGFGKDTQGEYVSNVKLTGTTPRHNNIGDGAILEGYSLDRFGRKLRSGKNEKRNTLGAIFNPSASHQPNQDQQRSFGIRIFGDDFSNQGGNTPKQDFPSQQTSSNSNNNNNNSNLSNPHFYTQNSNKQIKSLFSNPRNAAPKFLKSNDRKPINQVNLFPRRSQQEAQPELLKSNIRQISDEEPVREGNNTMSSNEEYFGLGRDSRLLSKTSDVYFPLNKVHNQAAKPSKRRESQKKRKKQNKMKMKMFLTRKITEESNDTSQGGSSSQINDLSVKVLRKAKRVKKGLKRGGDIDIATGAKGQELGRRLGAKISTHSRNKTLGQVIPRNKKKKKDSRRVESNFDGSHDRQNREQDEPEYKKDSSQEYRREDIYSDNEPITPKLKIPQNSKLDSGSKMRQFLPHPHRQLGSKLKGRHTPKYSSHTLRKAPPKIGKLKSRPGLLKLPKHSLKSLAKGSPSLLKKLLPPIIKKKSNASSKLSLRSDSCQNHILSKGSPLLKQHFRRNYKSPSIKRRKSPLLNTRFAGIIGKRPGSKTGRLRKKKFGEPGPKQRKSKGTENTQRGDFEIEVKEADVQKIFFASPDRPKERGIRGKIGSHRTLRQGRYRSPNKVPLIGKKQVKGIRRSNRMIGNIMNSKKVKKNVIKVFTERASASSDDSNSSSDGGSSDEPSSSN